MRRLTGFVQDDPHTESLVLERDDEIARRLEALGIRFERHDVPPGLPEVPEALREALDGPIRAWCAQEGFRSADVVRMIPDQPDAAALRARFLEEHTHDEDEVRWFLRGGGVFFLHLRDRVFRLACEAGDLLFVPAGTRHWFDAGPRPSFTALRLFTREDGWVARPTGSDIALRFTAAPVR